MQTYAATVVTNTPGITFPLVIMVPDGENVERRVAICAEVTARALLAVRRA